MTYNILTLSSHISDNSLKTVHTTLNEVANTFRRDFRITDIHPTSNDSQIASLIKSAHAVFVCNAESLRMLDICKNANLHTRLTRILSTDFDAIIASDAYGGLSANDSGYTNNGTFGREAFDVIRYSELEIERSARIAFEHAQTRQKSLLLADKADTLLSSKLWRKIVADINEDYPDVSVNALDISDALSLATQSPSRLDTILCPRIFADTLTSLLRTKDNYCSAQCYLGDTTLGAYCLLDNYNNALLSISSALRYSFDMQEEADFVENKIIT